MSTLFDEAEADMVVNNIISRVKWSKKMHIFKDTDGKIKLVHQAEEITREDLVITFNETREDFKAAGAALEEFDNLTKLDESEATPQAVTLEEIAPVSIVEAPVAPVPTVAATAQAETVVPPVAHITVLS